jgi:glycosyltransferase 2 family protein
MSFGTISKILIQCLVSFVLIYLVLQGVDKESLFLLLRKFSVSDAVILVVAAVVILGALQGMRWKGILGSLGSQVETKWAINVSFLAIFFNQVIPAMIGGEVSRIWLGKKNKISIQTLIVSVFADRIVGLVAIAMMCAIGLPFLFSISGSTNVFWSDVVLVGLSFIGTVFLFMLRSIPSWLREWRVIKAFHMLGEATWSVSQKLKSSLEMLLFSFLSHSTQIVLILFIAEMISVPLSVGHAMILCPPILFVSMLPVSLAGWGVREGAMVVGFSLIGISPDDALAISIIYGAMAIGIGAAGGGLWLTGHFLKQFRTRSA